jgi:hypothetical protein
VVMASSSIVQTMGRATNLDRRCMVDASDAVRTTYRPQDLILELCAC